MITKCPFPCTNKTEFGYCKTTVCLYAPTIRVTSLPRTNYDRITSKTPEELAEWLADTDACPCDVSTQYCLQHDCNLCWLEWLRQEVEM